jgi:nitroreductase
MQLAETILKRRMVRNFTDAPVPDEDVRRILELALHAPSAGFSQGWSYVVVRDETRRKEVGRFQDEESYADRFGHFISKAPVVISPAQASKSTTEDIESRTKSKPREPRWIGRRPIGSLI